MLEFGGIGHSMVIHSSDSEIILKFGLEKPAFRILVNTTSSLGAIGYTNELAPSLTLGPGTWGGSIVSENVTAKHLINIKRLTFGDSANQPSGKIWRSACCRSIKSPFIDKSFPDYFST